MAETLSEHLAGEDGGQGEYVATIAGRAVFQPAGSDIVVTSEQDDFRGRITTLDPEDYDSMEAFERYTMLREVWDRVPLVCRYVELLASNDEFPLELSTFEVVENENYDPESEYEQSRAYFHVGVAVEDGNDPVWYMFTFGYSEQLCEERPDAVEVMLVEEITRQFRQLREEIWNDRVRSKLVPSE